MKAPQLLHDLQSRGVMLQADGDRLRFEGPRDALTPQVLAAVKTQKFALLLLLKHSHAAPKPKSELPNTPASTCSGFDVGGAFDARALLAYADELHQGGELTSEQHANLIEYARAARDGSHHRGTQTK
jgi:hypothetical protein